MVSVPLDGDKLDDPKRKYVCLAVAMVVPVWT